MLTLEDLTVSYGREPVLQNLSLQCTAGHIYGLIGRNGSGKTTLFHTIYGWLQPDSGRLQWANKRMNRKWAAILETRSFFYSGITGREYLSLFAGRKTPFPTEPWEELFQLDLDTLIEHYSTGMKKKLALVALLKGDKPLLLLDEPFNGVDLEAVEIIRQLLLQLKAQGKMIVISSHVLETLTGLCDAVYWLEDKKIKRTFEPAELPGLAKALFEDSEAEIKRRINKGLS